MTLYILFACFALASRGRKQYLGGITNNANTMMLSNLFHRSPSTIHHSPLAIKGIGPAPLTPEPDDAELAATALLESMADVRRKKEDVRCMRSPAKGTPAYYQALAIKIKGAHAQEARAAMRFIAYCEDELRNTPNAQNTPNAPTEKLAALERGLFKHQSAVEREGGGVLRRWQHCLADVTVRQMPLNFA